jgi:hypothetical protein
MVAGGRAPRRRAFVVVGALTVAVAVAVGLAATAFDSWGQSVCAETAAVVGAHRHTLRVHLFIVWLLVACVPVGFGAVARSARRRVWPWAIIAGVVMAFGLALGLTAEPSRWCLY